MIEANHDITVLAVDDHPLMREGIAAVIDAEPGMRMVAQAASGREAIEAHRTHQPDITLMDVRMPDMDGITAMTAVRSECPQARIIILTNYPGDVQVARAIKAGAMGYLFKSMLRRELIDTIRTVMGGVRRIPAEVAKVLADHLTDDLLSTREIQVLEAVAAGRSNKQVAAALSITEETAKAHMRNIMAKLGASDRTQAVTIALRRGILSL